MILNSLFLVNVCDGLGNGTTSKVETHSLKIGNKEINDKNHVCWVEQVGGRTPTPSQGESPKFTCG